MPGIIGAAGMPGIIGAMGMPGIIGAMGMPGIIGAAGIGAGCWGAAAGGGGSGVADGLPDSCSRTVRARSAFVFSRSSASNFMCSSYCLANSGLASNSLDLAASARLSSVLTIPPSWSEPSSSWSDESGISSLKNLVLRMSATRSSMLSCRSAGVLAISLSTNRSSSGDTLLLKSEGGVGLVEMCLLSRSLGEAPVNGG